MAKFSGVVGYAQTAETADGVFEEVITERTYFGDVVQNGRQLQVGTEVNPKISISNSISIVADAYARDHFFAIRYVMWAGVRWIVPQVDVQHPRLILRLGEVYNGPTA